MTEIKRPNLEKLTEEGFKYNCPIICPMHISEKAYFLQVYEKKVDKHIEYALYLKHEDKIIQRYRVNAKNK
jgi:hypothetical protein